VLSYLPQNADAPLPLAPPQDPVGGDPGALVPAEQRSVYDVRAVARAIVDGAELLELSPRWARNMVTAFARLNGHPIGVIANQPRYIGGVIDCAAAMKGARFVRMCNAYGLPLVVLVDTPGFMPGTQQEEAGIIRHGAKLLYAFAEATVPKVTVILRKAYGGAYISMNSKDLGADFAFAWPNAQIGIMSAKQAVQIIHSRKLASGTLATAWEELVAEYEDAQLRARVAAREGNVDDIIEPRTTRERLLAAFGLLTNVSARQSRPGNIPL
jgi:acetyl-CoA carboxylase carboxyltransferase component